MRRIKIVTIIYSCFVIALAISLINPTLNYLFFYRTIERLRLVVPQLTFKLEGNTLNLSGVVCIENNERYEGIAIKTIYVNFYLVNKTGETIPITGKTFWYSPPNEIKPYSNITETFELFIQVGQRVISILKTEKPTWMITGNMWINTFIGEIQIFLEPFYYKSN